MEKSKIKELLVAKVLGARITFRDTATGRQRAGIVCSIDQQGVTASTRDTKRYTVRYGDFEFKEGIR